jgi:hypothetical protein
MPPPPEVQHRRAQDALTRRTGLALAGIIALLPEPETQEAMDRYHGEALRVVGGGQAQAVRFSFAYMAAVSPPSPRKPPPTIARALEGIAITAESPVTSSPMLRLWKLLKENEEPELAAQLAGSYANGLASAELQLAQRGGLIEGARAGKRGLRGWTKALSGNACAWCRSVAAGTYRSPDAVPFHERDHCSVAPVFHD